MSLVEKVLFALDNLIRGSKIDIPVKSDVLMDLAIGALGESLIEGSNICSYFQENPVFLLDNVHFDESNIYNLHDIMSEVLCFRLISIMMDYLDELKLEYETDYDIRITGEDFSPFSLIE